MQSLPVLALVARESTLLRRQRRNIILIGKMEMNFGRWNLSQKIYWTAMEKKRVLTAA